MSVLRRITYIHNKARGLSLLLGEEEIRNKSTLLVTTTNARQDDQPDETTKQNAQKMKDTYPGETKLSQNKLCILKNKMARCGYPIISKC